MSLPAMLPVKQRLCLFYNPDAHRWCHGLIVKVLDQSIKVREAITDEIKVVKLPLSKAHFRYLTVRAEDEEDGDEERDSVDEEALRKGDVVEVFWEADDMWYRGRVEKESMWKGLYILYDDGAKEWLTWHEMKKKGEKFIRLASGDSSVGDTAASVKKSHKAKKSHEALSTSLAVSRRGVPSVSAAPPRGPKRVCADNLEEGSDARHRLRCVGDTSTSRRTRAGGGEGRRDEEAEGK